MFSVKIYDLSQNDRKSYVSMNHMPKQTEGFQKVYMLVLKGIIKHRSTY